MSLAELEKPKEAALAAAKARFGPRVALAEPFPGRPPLWIEPVDAALKTDIQAAARWMAQHRDAVEEALITFGAVLWRGLPVRESDDFAALMASFEVFEKGYTAGTTDRQAIKGHVMEATRTPPEVYILLHQEMSYLPDSPRALAFFCRQASPIGGETPICDMRGLLEALPRDIQHKLIETGVLYVRNMRSDAVSDWRADPAYRHPSWQYRFATDDPALVEQQLEARHIDFRWEADKGLTFWTRLPGVTTHPVTGERLFFNQLISQANHRVSVGDSRADFVDAAYGDAVLRPYFTAFGDGKRPTEAEFMVIHREFERRMVSFAWRPGDIMIVENKLTAHGRRPFSGPRDMQVMLLG